MIKHWMVIGVALFATGACSKSTDTAATTTSAPVSTTAPGSAASGVGSSTVGDLSTCTAWVKAYYGVQGIIGVPAAKDAQQTLPKLDAAAAAEIKADWQTLSPLYRAVADSIVTNGQTADQTNTAVAAINAKAPQKAIVNIQTWAATCR